MAWAIFLALIGVPLIEIAVFIRVGEVVGLWWTLTLIVATAVIGTAMLRVQGLATLARARDTLERGGTPVQEVLDGVCLLISGALLLTPGFVTDAAGALMLIPAVRLVLQRWALTRVSAAGRAGSPPHRGPGGDGDVIDGEYTEVNETSDALPPGNDRGRRL
jgi:UPF0716 protein FxsA